MDSFPDDVMQHILSNLSNAKDLAPCLCVSKNFKRNLTHHKTLCFPRRIFHNLKPPPTPDGIVTQMLSSIPRLEELVACCPFTNAALASWLPIVGSSLKNLELFVAYDHNNKFPDYNLDCIQAASRNLESLKLWRVAIAPTPKWQVFQKLRNLEINGAKLENSILTEALRVTPNLTRLVLRSCQGLSIIHAELLELRHCELYVYNRERCALRLRAPKLEYLAVQDFRWITVYETNCLKSLSMSHYRGGRTCQWLDFGNLMALESLNVHGDRWGGDLISKMLRLASDLKHLHLHFHLAKSSPFPDFDFVELFESLPKLESFSIGGDMLIFICNLNNPKKVVSNLVIPGLEEVVLFVPSPKYPKKLDEIKLVIRMIQSLVKYGNKLKKLKIKTDPVMTEDGTADYIFDKICRSVISTRWSMPYWVFRHSKRELRLIRTLC